MLEDGVQADDSEVLFVKQLVEALGLGQPVRDATGAEHLKRVQCHHTPTQAGQRERLRGVEPLRDTPFGCEGRSFGHEGMLRVSGHWATGKRRLFQG